MYFPIPFDSNPPFIKFSNVFQPPRLFPSPRLLGTPEYKMKHKVRLTGEKRSLWNRKFTDCITLPLFARIWCKNIINWAHDFIHSLQEMEIDITIITSYRGYLNHRPINSWNNIENNRSTVKHPYTRLFCKEHWFCSEPEVPYFVPWFEPQSSLSVPYFYNCSKS